MRMPKKCIPTTIAIATTNCYISSSSRNASITASGCTLVQCITNNIFYVARVLLL
jgi:hypothetical protein